MAAAVAASALPVTFGRLVSACSRGLLRPSWPGAASPRSGPRRFGSRSAPFPQGYVPKTSLSSPPWPEVVLPDPAEETRHHAGKRQSERTAGLGAPGPGSASAHTRFGRLAPEPEALVRLAGDGGEGGALGPPDSGRDFSPGGRAECSVRDSQRGSCRPAVAADTVTSRACGVLGSPESWRPTPMPGVTWV
ncbi:39S ribosomal protein L21, mitochondrial isoform X2 [Rousettus aegyptiacus]|uniref:39S ribosomal protein L21, mitochondrial isoform X2 n=1 Tax=Rousettus aegyptiacus TaxID=9407 RepID=UPI00168D66E1|nr:39S ribosomal protein L21, mitochondrial isoform X2 [Rousettus aegyptiacus]